MILEIMMKRIYPPRKSLPTFKDLNSIGWAFNLEFHPPPFDGDKDEYYFDIHDLKEVKEFQDFIGLIDRFGIPYEYGKQKKSKRICLIINRRHLNGL